MRHTAHGRHARKRNLSLRHYLMALLAAVAALVTALSFAAGPSRAATAAPAAHQARAGRAAPVLDAVNKTVLAHAARTAAARIAALVLAERTYTVRGGDSISGVAASRCGSARDWTGIYAASRARGWTARDANVITSGQHLYLACAFDAAQLRFAVTAPRGAAHVSVAVAVAHAAAGSSSGDSDGDSEGGVTQHGTYRAAATAITYRAAPASYGTYSYAGLEALWISAGGPSWAAAHAASIAECESGGRTSAYNPSGATGLWQILGAVVGGNLYNAYTNALNAVSKFRASGDTFSQWVCR